MREYRISKYDPAYRIDGVYQRDEWTSIADVGLQFGGQLLSMEDYLAVEQTYIRFLSMLADKLHAFPLRVSNLESNTKYLWKEGQKIGRDAFPLIVADCLRENCWCQLLAKEFFIHFGYEYYAYVGCDLSLDEIKNTASEFGLFVEERTSPYMCRGDNPI